MQTIVTNNREVLKDPTGTRVVSLFSDHVFCPRSLSPQWSGWIIQSINSGSVAMGALGKELFTYGKPAGYWIIPFGM